MNEESSDRTEGRRSSAFSFDTTGFSRLFDEVQRLGFDTAAALVDQFQQVAERTFGDTGMTGAGTDRTTGDGYSSERLREDVQKMMDASFEMMKASWDAMAACVELAPRPREASRRGGGVGRVELAPASPGDTATGYGWLRNEGPGAATGVKLRSTDLISEDGDVIPTGSVSFDPAQVDSLAESSDRYVRIEVSVPERTPPGTYHSVVVGTTRPTTIIVVSAPVVAKEQKDT